ncbi:hypothetical protein MTO96_045583 [Rhipicephalus appendiculatus]
MLPGPFRAASKPGVFVTMFAFFDIYAKRDLLTNDPSNQWISVRGTVGGYAVEVDCWFWRMDTSKDVVYFRVELCDGEWNHYVEWPFSKKITVIVTHLRNSEKDIRLPMIERSEHDDFRKPAPGSCHFVLRSEEVNWKDLELNGFIVNRTLYANIEFE